MKPTKGRIVMYTLSKENAEQINRRRTNGVDLALGTQAHIGKEAIEGQSYPMIVTAMWSDNLVNGQVFLDGNDAFWALSVNEGTLPGMWMWPKREE